MEGTRLSPGFSFSQRVLDELDMEGCAAVFESDESKRDLRAPAGKEHYRLLAYFASTLSDALIVDIGTHRGLSAVALAANPSNRVLTFDIQDFIAGEHFGKIPNIERCFDNLWEPPMRLRWRETLLSAKLIFVDIEPHGGEMEMELLRWLDGEGYAGWLLCDDVWFFKAMRDRFWSLIPAERKVDLTAVGHWSGTGLVTFAESAALVSVLAREDEQGNGCLVDSPAPIHVPQEGRDRSEQWTAVTAFFDLSKLTDATAEIRARDPQHFLTHAAMTLALNVNMVVYCDPEWKEALEQLRPVHLRHRTLFLPRAFTLFPLVQQWHPVVFASRGGSNGTHVDPRNTTSYYLMCMLRYVMLSETIASNPFASSHFAWVNLCIERMSWRSAMYFPRVWNELRDRFSSCYIDYQPRALASDLVEYFRVGGRCGMCSGFFTGSAHYMGLVSRLLLDKFEALAREGHGHADEQLFSLVYFDRPALFEPYLGDYAEMVVNYGRVRQNAHAPVMNVLRNLAASREDPRLLAKLCARWLESVRRGCCGDVPDQLVVYVTAIFRDAVLEYMDDLRTTVCE